MSKRIRITGAGIHGMPTADNPTGEYPIGHEFDTDADMPLGWKGRAVVVGEEPADGSVFVGNEDDGEVAKVRRDLIEKAEAEFDRLKESHADTVKFLTERAEKAEADLKAMTAERDDIAAKLFALEGDTSGATDGKEAASAADITTAIAMLDKSNNDHWTDAGLPRVEAVAELTGKVVSRKSIEEAAPDAKRSTE